VRGAKALLVAAVGVAPQRIPGTAALRALDLQVPAGTGLIEVLWTHPRPSREHERGTRVNAPDRR